MNEMLDVMVLQEMAERAELEFRAGLDQNTIERYEDVLKQTNNGTWPFPPLVVYSVTDYYGNSSPADVLVSGRHRLAAAKRAGWEQVPIRRETGTRQQARITGIVENGRHGMNFTRIEKRKAITWMLIETDLPMRKIAAAVGAHHRTVLRVKAEEKIKRPKEREAAKQEAETVESETTVLEKQVIESPPVETPTPEEQSPQVAQATPAAQLPPGAVLDENTECPKCGGKYWIAGINGWSCATCPTIETPTSQDFEERIAEVRRAAAILLDSLSDVIGTDEYQEVIEEIHSVVNNGA